MLFKRSVRTILLLFGCLGALVGPRTTDACGIPLSARIPSEQALIVFGEGREEIITRFHLESEGPGAAVIVPVPAVPEVGVLENDQIFQYLEEVTRPEVRTREVLVWDSLPRTGAGADAPEGVNLFGREVIGGYDVAQLGATDVVALQSWLDENGYTVPAGAAPILQSYIDDGWKFVAVKLAPTQSANGTLSPLRLLFEAQEIVYPMRLGVLAEHTLDVQLYVVADHRVTIAGMDTHYAGPVAKLDHQPPRELASLFRAPYLTELRNYAVDPDLLTDDFVAHQAASDEPFRKIETRTVYVNGWDRLAVPIIGLIAVLISSAVALGIAFGLRRRMHQIAGPGPEQSDD